MTTADGGEPEGLVTISSVVLALWDTRRWLLGGLVLGATATIGLSFLMRPVYQSQAVLAPVNEGAGGRLSDLIGQFGGVAALAGVRPPSGGDRQEAIEYLKSRGFVARFIERNQLLPVLFPARWDADAGRWRVSADDVPTLEDGVRRFIRDVRRVQEDRGTGMVTLAVKWQNRELAARWVGQLIDEVNAELRDRAVDEARRGLEYINSRLPDTKELPVREAMYKLVESQLSTIVLANVRRDYAFRVVDPPYVPAVKDYVSPNRPLMGVLGGFGGAFAGVLIGLYRRRRKPGPVGE